MLQQCALFYDKLHHTWESFATQRRLTLILIIFFIGSLLLIESNRFFMLPEWISRYIPKNHFSSISLVFTLVLAIELIGMVFTVAYSISKTLRIQLEILALILIRQAFKGVAGLEESFFTAQEQQVVWHILISATAALCVFVCILLYKKIPRLLYPTQIWALQQYVMAKKSISLILLLGVILIALYTIYKNFILVQHVNFFESIYSMLIFADILLVLVTQYYVPSFLGMFRNSGFVVCTLLIRIALASQIEWMALLGIFSALYALALAWISVRLIDNQSGEET